VLLFIVLILSRYVGTPDLGAYLSAARLYRFFSFYKEAQLGWYASAVLLAGFQILFWVVHSWSEEGWKEAAYVLIWTLPAILWLPGLTSSNLLLPFGTSSNHNERRPVPVRAARRAEAGRSAQSIRSRIGP
jgi:ABC-type Fe3+-siderophore transport system permease subunit